MSAAGGSPSSYLATGFSAFLRTHLLLCDEAFNLHQREKEALSSTEPYPTQHFASLRKNLLPRLESSLIGLRQWRQAWQETALESRGGDSELRALFQKAQNLLMNVLLLDRENQQALLQRGLVPARHLPSFLIQQPDYAASRYRRHAQS